MKRKRFDEYTSHALWESRGKDLKLRSPNRDKKMNNDEDPFAWISASCHVSSSQEEILNNAPFVLPNLASSTSKPKEDKEEDRVVIIVSDSDEEDEVFMTPRTHSLTSSNEARLGIHQDEVMVCGGHENLQKTVDLSSESDVFGGDCARLNATSVREAEGVDKMEEDDAMGSKDVEGNRGLSVNDKIVFDANELRCNGKNIVDEVNKCVWCAATNCVCVLANRDSASSKLRILPSSFFIGNAGEDGRYFRQRTDKRDGGVGTSQGGRNRAGNFRPTGDGKGVDEQRNGDADDSNGKDPSKTNEEKEPSEDALTDNILKVLGLLAKQSKPVYKEKVDIIGAAIKAGITFPRPSWWPEDTDDDSD